MDKDVKNATILVVDDDASLLELCKNFLEEQGFNVLTALDGKDALDILRKYSVDVVLCDINMPNLDGVALLKTIKKEKIDADFLVMSGVGTIQTAVQIIKMGALDYISKPFYLPELLVKIKKVLEHRRLRKERIDLDTIVEVLKEAKNLFLSLEISDLLNNLLFQLDRLFNPTDVSIWLKDEGGEIKLSRFIGRLLRKDSNVLSVLKDLTVYIMKKENPLLLQLYEDLALDEELKFLKPLCKYKISLMASPIIGKKGIIGVVILMRTQEVPYSSKEFNLFNIFISQISPQVENCLFYTRLQDLNKEIIRSIAKAVEAKDYYTKGHSDKVAFYAVRLGSKLSLSKEDLDSLYWAGILHDVGKIGIPDNILNKPGKLTKEEFETMKQHPVIGMEILSQITTMKEILPLVYYHHERVDGKGYPEGLKEDQIPKLTRILSVVDAFDAMTSDRAYRKAMEWDQVKSILQEGAGTQWDPDFVDVWIKVVEEENILKNKGEKS